LREKFKNQSILDKAFKGKFLNKNVSPLIENLLRVEATDHKKIQEEIQKNQTKSRTPHQSKHGTGQTRYGASDS